MLQKSKLVWRFGLLTAAALLSISGAAAQQRPLVLSGGTLIDGTGKAPVPDAVVVVQNQRITAVGRRGQVRIPSGANVVNLRGRTILPGLIEGHVHSFDWQAPMMLHYGITTMFDFDINPAWIVAQKEMYNNGRIKGPRMYIAGGKMWGPLMAPLPVPFPETSQMVRTPEEATAYLKSMEALGVDFLKIDDSLTYPQLQAAIDEGKRSGLKVLAHVQNIRIAGNMGIKFAEHFWPIWNALLDPDGKKYGAFEGMLTYPKGAVGLPQVSSESLVDPKDFPDLIKFMVDHGIVFNPTMLGAWGNTTPVGAEYIAESAKLAKDPELAWVPQEGRNTWANLGSRRPSRKADYEVGKRFMKEFSDAGGRINVGSEGTSGLSTHYEMYMLAEAGIPNMKIIQGATLWNAENVGKEKDIGSVEVGKYGDFTIIEGDPLKDIRVTMNIRMVIKGGEVMDTKYDPNWKNPIPRPYSTPPVIQTIWPMLARQGDQSATVDINGTGFREDSIVRLDNADMPTKFISPTKLQVTLGAAQLRNTGEYTLYVVNPGGARGAVSTNKYFLVAFKP